MSNTYIWNYDNNIVCTVATDLKNALRNILKKEKIKKKRHSIDNNLCISCIDIENSPYYNVKHLQPIILKTFKYTFSWDMCNNEGIIIHANNLIHAKLIMNNMQYLNKILFTNLPIIDKFTFYDIPKIMSINDVSFFIKRKTKFKYLYDS